MSAFDRQREREALLCCSRPRLCSESGARLDSLFDATLDWPWILATARDHGILPLLSVHLSARCAGRLESTTLQMLRESFTRTARRNLLMAHELLGIADMFAGNGIAALPYKGPLLAASEYRDLARRPFCDLDILIRKPDLARATALLSARGYVPEHRLGPVHERTWLRARNDINLRHPDLDVVVELHWEVVPRRLCVPFHHARLWRQTHTVTLGGRQVQTLSPEDLLIVLCVHGAKHGWSRAIWIADIAAMVTNHADLDWPDVLTEVRRMGVERMLAVGLRLAQDVAGCSLSPRLRTLTEHRGTAALARDVRARLFETAADAHNAFRQSWFHVKIRERLRDKLRFALYSAIVPSGTDRLLLPLPVWFSIVYYLLRPFRLTLKYLWRPVASRVSSVRSSS